jgi:uncharacterized protein YijF (DUF1287 family)
MVAHFIRTGSQRVKFNGHEKMKRNPLFNPAVLLTKLACAACIACFVAGCSRDAPKQQQITFPKTGASPPAVIRQPVIEYAAASPVVAAARSQIGKTIIYDPSYVGLKYPGGDVPIEKGVCTDVIVRAFRDALEMDLQKLVHQDMRISFSKYPKIWGLKRPDRNIDHRRVPNLQRYFQRKGFSLAVTKQMRDYLPGDVVTCTVPPNRPHIMIVSDRRTSEGLPLVIHNIGRGAQEENQLFVFPLTGHYRINSDG